MRAAGVLVVLATWALLALLPASAASQPVECGGSIGGETGRYRFQVLAIRGVTCERARRVARRYDWLQAAPSPWQCFLARASDRPRLFSCGAGGTAGDVRGWPQALEARLVAGAGRPTRLAALRVRLAHPRTVARVRVCGEAGGRVHVRIRETMSPPGRNRPVLASKRRSRTRRQARRCQTHRFSWRTGDAFFGAGRYRVAVRARTSGRRWSPASAGSIDTFD